MPRRFRRRSRIPRYRVGQDAPEFPFRAFDAHERIPSGRDFLVLVASSASTPEAQLHAALDRVERVEGVLNFPDIATRRATELHGLRLAWEVFTASQDLNASRVVAVAAPLGRGIFDTGRDAPPGAAEQYALAEELFGIVSEDVPAAYRAGLRALREVGRKPSSIIKWVIGGAAAVAATVGVVWVLTRRGS